MRNILVDSISINFSNFVYICLYMRNIYVDNISINFSKEKC